MARLMTTLNFGDALKLVKEEELFNSELNVIEPKLKEVLMERLKETTSIEEGVIMCVHTVDGETVSLPEHYSDMTEFLYVENETLVLEIKVDDDMILSMPFDTLINFRNRIEAEEDPELLDLIYKDFKDSLMPGKIDPIVWQEKYDDYEMDNIISFIPAIDIKCCKMFVRLNKDWENEDFSLGNVPQLKLKRMEL
ncbi:hypothetical protein UT300012_24330 [Paraclostridium bifermentans]